MYRPNFTSVADRTRVAILGIGYWGVNYVRIFDELPDAEVAVVCDQHTARLDEVARRFPGVALTDDIDEALAVDGVDAVVVCTPARTHREIAGRALEAGKHVLVEKPLTTTVDEADELVNLSEVSERVLVVGHTFLYNPGVRKVRALLDQGALGDIYYLAARRTNLGPIRADVNAIWDLAPHDVAIFNHILGRKPEWVSAVGARVLGTSREDVGFVSLGYDDNLIAHAHVSWIDPHKVREVVVVGSDARVSFDDLNLTERVRVFEKGVKPAAGGQPRTFGEFHLQMRDGDIRSPSVPAVEPLKHVSGHFLHCVRRGERPRTNGEQGRDVVAVMQAVDESVARKGAPVFVEDILLWNERELQPAAG
jgi:predicted dehydrogenase